MKARSFLAGLLGLLFWTAAAGAFATEATETRPGVAAIVIGDPAGAGNLQRDLEERIADVGGARAIDGDDVARSLAVPRPAQKARNPELARKAAALFGEAATAYYRDRAAQALGLLDQVGKIQDQDPETPPRDHVRWQLWRMAVQLALGNRDKADRAALAALALDPKLEVDPAEFPPSMQVAISDLRMRRGRSITLLVPGVPEGGAISLDGRPAAERNEVFAGPHRVTVSAPGRLDLTRTLDAESDTSIQISLPLLLDSAMQTAVTSIIDRGAVVPMDAPALASLGARIHADWVVLARAGNATRAVVIRLPAGKPAFASAIVPKESAGTIAPWVEGVLNREIPPPRRAVRASAGLPSAWRFDSRAAVIAASSARDVTGTNGNPLHARFDGAGPEVGVEVSRGSWVGGVEGSWLDYGSSYMDVKLKGSATTRAHGGSTLSLASFGGARIPLGASSQGSWISLEAAVAFEQLSSKDVSDSSGKLGAFPDRNRLALEARAGAGLPIVAGTHPIALRVGVAGAPWSTWTERPAGNTGDAPAPTVALSWRLGAEASLNRRVTFGAEYRGALRGVRFSGDANGRAFNGMRDARESEQIHAFALSAGFGF